MAFQAFSPRRLSAGLRSGRSGRSVEEQAPSRERVHRTDDLGKWSDVWKYVRFLRHYIYKRGYFFFSYLEILKDLVVGLLYKRRGKFARPFLHTALMSIMFAGITFGPLIVQQATADSTTITELPSAVLRSSTGDVAFVTEQSEEVARFRGGEVIEHTVQPEETISTIAQKYGLAQETILWENNLTQGSTIRPGDRLRILPTDGVMHRVAKGETVFTLAKRYGLGDDDAGAQPIISFPFNTFADDNTFALTTGQTILIPGGIKPQAATIPRTVARVTTPDAGAVSASGQFVWPASGYISQGFSWYHKAYDIANRGGGRILAADSGKVVVAGWVDNSGYGNRVMIDHGNGFVTLYAHLSVVRVSVGQTVNKGDVIGDMGSTGRSTGVHLHFEIRQGGALLNPGSYLR